MSVAETSPPRRARLGTVGEVAEAWGLLARLRRATADNPAFADVIDSMVEVSRRAKTLAGTAYAEQRRIVLNAALLQPGREADRNATFLHECAHLIADLATGRRNRHGPVWRDVMALLGEPAVVTHNLPYLSRAAHAAVTWICTACGTEHHFVRRPRRRIRDCYCRTCGPARGRLSVKRAAPGAPA